MKRICGWIIVIVANGLAAEVARLHHLGLAAASVLCGGVGFLLGLLLAGCDVSLIGRRPS